MTTTPNPADLGELVARLSALANCEANETADALNEAADALAAAHAKANTFESWAMAWHRTVETMLTVAGLSSALSSDEAAEAMRAHLAAQQREIEGLRQTSALLVAHLSERDDQLAKAEAEVAALQARVEAYEAPNGWRVLHALDARRVLGDPARSFGPNGLSAQGEVSHD